MSTVITWVKSRGSGMMDGGGASSGGGGQRVVVGGDVGEGPHGWPASVRVAIDLGGQNGEVDGVGEVRGWP